MLEQVCDHLHNYFEQSKQTGTFYINGGAIDLPFLLDGQRFRIQGSALNDGIYTYHTSGSIYDDDDSKGIQMKTEQFHGTITAMGVPPALVALAAEIGAWVTANASALNSPYTSESFGGYSYTKESGGSGGSGAGVYGWQDKFWSRLNAYRKIA